MKRLAASSGIFVMTLAFPLLMSGPACGYTAEQLKELCGGYLSEGDNENALSCIDEALELAPDSASYYVIRGAVYAVMGNTEASVADYETALRLNPEDKRPLVGIAMTFFGAHMFQEAHDRMTYAISLCPDSAAFYQMRAIVSCPLENYGEVEADLLKAMELDPGFAPAYDNMGSILGMEGRYEDALPYFMSAVELAPDSAQYYFDRGNCYYYLNLLGLALQDYTSAIEVDPDYAKAYSERAYVREALPGASVDEILADYTRAIELDPTEPLNLRRRSTILYDSGDAEGALADLDRAVEIAPDDPDAVQDRALFYMDEENWDMAILDLERAMDIAPGYSLPYFNRALVMYEQGNVEACVEDFGRAIERAPGFAQAYLYRAAALEELGDFDAARADLETCIEITDDEYVRAQAESELEYLEE